ncbi:MAG: phosphatidylserine decarboxylase [Clostridium sp.]|uniref:phosphatidylserine decarboxylase n=1 Tax=Clostridium sp. TaxID=1506 RepID=UPI0030705054
MIKYYNRKNKIYEIESVAGDGVLSLIYSNTLGKHFLPSIAKRKFLTTIYGRFCDMKISKSYISNFVKDFNINMKDYAKNIDEYTSFNDFFYRELTSNSRSISDNQNTFISPCDGKLLAINKINSDTSFSVKGFKYNIDELIKNKSISDTYKNGTCLIFRLCPTDYHRFHFLDSGICSTSKIINGHYYSVNPVALENISNVFSENKREYSLLKSDNFDDVLYIEVGATFVGSIIQTYSSTINVNRGDEKGYFKFGGSTIIVFIKENIVNLDEDILAQSSLGIETAVHFGEKIGVRI